MWNELNAAELRCQKPRQSSVIITVIYYKFSRCDITGPVFDISVDIKASEIGNSD